MVPLQSYLLSFDYLALDFEAIWFWLLITLSCPLNTTMRCYPIEAAHN